MLWRHHNDTFSWVDALSISEIRVFFCCFQELSGFKNTNGYPNKMWDKSKTTRAVDIAQLTHHEVQGGGKNPETEGRGIFATTADRLQCQPMESRFWDGLLCYNTQRCELNVHAKTTMMHFISMFNNKIINE